MLRKAKEAQADAAFEAANPSFVASFKADAEKRQAAEAEKVARASKAKERGTLAFKRGDVHSAIRAYHEALLLTPFNVALLNNLALMHLHLARTPPDQTTSASSADSPTTWAQQVIEFTTRALRVDPSNVKALFRRATALLLQVDLTGAGRV